MGPTELYYDPYDVEIDADPYPTYRRLRDEAPLYYNEKLDFWGLGRFADVEAALKDWQRLSSAKGDIHRSIGQALTFGYGPHYCLGAAPARMEGRVALDDVLNRWPEWEIDTANARRSPTSTVRGWDTMPAVVA